MKINCKGWSKRTETIKEEYNYIHGNNHLIERINDNSYEPHKILFQLAYEDGLDSPLTIQSKKLINQNKIDFSYMEILNRKKSLIRNGVKKP